MHTPPREARHERAKPFLDFLLRGSTHSTERSAVKSALRADHLVEFSLFSAGFFHTATKDVPFIDMDTQMRALHDKGRRTPMPEAAKRYKAARSVTRECIQK